MFLQISLICFNEKDVNITKKTERKDKNRSKEANGSSKMNMANRILAKGSNQEVPGTQIDIICLI